MNAREARWFHRPGRGNSLPLTGSDEFEAETYFPILGMSTLLIVEGQERPLRRWDFVHCPPEPRHVFVGAGDGPCVILAVGSRQFQANGPWGEYTVDDAARRHDACPDEETQDSGVAYARFAPARPTRYRGGLLPD
jgi:hypothetical protein